MTTRRYAPSDILVGLAALWALTSVLLLPAGWPRAVLLVLTLAGMSVCVAHLIEKMNQPTDDDKES